MLNKDKKIYYYGENDMANIFNEERLKYLLSKQNASIDDILECFAAELLLKNELHHDVKESKEKIGRNVAKCRNFIEENLPKIQDINVREYLENIEDPEYVKLFWRLIEQSKIYEDLSDEGFNSVAYSTNQKNFNLSHILYNKELSQKWNKSIIEYLIKNPRWIPNIINKHINENNYNSKLNVPKSIDNYKVFNELVEIYVDSTEANPNTLLNIFQFRNQDGFRINNELRFKAKTKYKEIVPKPSKLDGILQWKSIKKTYKHFFENGKLEIDYPDKWMIEPYNFTRLFLNFKDVLELIDEENRLKVINFQVPTLERFTSNWTPDSYKAGSEFQCNLKIIGSSLRFYDQTLAQICHLRIEDIIDWFFNKYIPKKFNIKNLTFKPTYKEATFLEKCRMILPQFDSILRGYDYYSKYNKIDDDFLNNFSDAIDIKDVKSKVSGKYVYFKQGVGSRIAEVLFDDQVLLPIGNYENFYEFLDKKEVFPYNELRSTAKILVDDLLNNKILKLIDQNIELNNSYKYILKEIYYNKEFQPYYHLDLAPKVDELKNLEIVECKSTLFPKSESDFYDFMFNDRQFDNGLRIRNRYIHGNNNLAEATNEINYYYILIFMIQLMFRIREDCMLSVSVKDSKKSI